ncbi:MAG: glycosyltransferase family 2 protein [Bacteriovoracia bacterium]
MRPLASVIMTTYNAPRHLALALAGMQMQSELSFELHIADDGSTEETTELVEAFMRKAPFPVVYSWQQDLGYRKTKILNEAIRKARSDYLIFVDGDCICHADFVKNHVRFREAGRYLAGRRVDLGPAYSRTLTPEMVLRGDLNRFNMGLLWSCVQKDSQYFHRSFAVDSPWLRKLLKMEKIDDLKGCNFSVDKESVVKVNGFDEDYQGYAREDTDLEKRLQYLGLKIKSLKGLAIQYHVWHERLAESESNKKKLEEISYVPQTVCKNGLMKL